MECRDFSDLIRGLQGPVLILGGSGFIGANLLKALLAVRADVYGTASSSGAWRLEGIPEKNKVVVDLLADADLEAMLDLIRPRTIFNVISYGSYSFESDPGLIYETNFNLTARIMHRLDPQQVSCYVHSGSSSEYGDNSAGPAETVLPAPNSDYAVSKVACANLIRYFGAKKHLPCANLRLYSVYGPLEDPSRLIPTIIREGVEGRYPVFVDRNISRDFVYIDDVVAAFVCTALNLREGDYGESFNIGTGRKTEIVELASVAGELFGIAEAPRFATMPNRSWDVGEWYANPEKAERRLGWRAGTTLREGLNKTWAWYWSLPDRERYDRSSKQFRLDTTYSLTAIVACYRDNQAIPIMYQRLTDVFTRLHIDYEIIFVNDNSPDDSEDVIRDISRGDKRVTGISHSRNFGSQAAFRSGMEMAAKNACVLMDGDLQDPPELIEQFVAKWREGFDVVYGRRVKREAPFFMRLAYKLFYRIFDCFSYLSIPHDAGDFSLMDRKVVQWTLRFPERDLFLRGIRAFVGFKQVGVDYMRPERMFGRTTNSLFKNIGWAKKGIFSFSNTPLTILSTAGGVLFIITVVLGIAQIMSRLLFPSITPRGVTTMLLCILFFGSVNLLAVGIVGEYIAKIFEEVKRRPLFIRRALIRDGEIKPFRFDRKGGSVS
jgi:nucleoside-diphosphate-sugar epimerase/glycosyltransferase involved in cell wall biosynthesis